MSVFLIQSENYENLRELIEYPRKIDVCTVEKVQNVRGKIGGKQHFKSYRQVTHGKKHKSYRKNAFTLAESECEDRIDNEIGVIDHRDYRKSIRVRTENEDTSRREEK